MLGFGDHALQQRDTPLYRRCLLKCRVDNRAVRNRRLEFVVNRLNFGRRCRCSQRIHFGCGSLQIDQGDNALTAGPAVESRLSAEPHLVAGCTGGI